MGWEVLGDDERATFIDNTNMVGFGPVHLCYEAGDAREELREFGRHLPADPREYSELALLNLYDDWNQG